MTDVEAEITDQQLASRGMQEILNDKSKTFDLLLLETAGISPFHALADHFGVPVVGITSADAHTIVHEAIGNPANAVTHPDRVLPFVTAKSFAQRLGSFTFTLLMKFIITPRNERKQIELLEKHFPNVKKSPAELIRNVDLQFTNTHPALGFIRPLLPSTIQLGFLHVKPPMSLPDDLLQLVEKSKHGVIFMSFGTIVTSKLAMKNFGSFLRAFADLEFDVLWKYDGEIPAAVPSNVHFRKWFPQSDLLAHPKVKLFITQGGLHSIEESITRRVPMLICPFHGDQGANAERSAERGISKSLNIHEELDSNHIKSAINGMITDSSFETNIAQLAKLVEDVSMSSREKALWHIEFVIRHKGARHLKYPQKDVSLFQLHHYDILLSVVSTLLLALFVFFSCKRLLNLKTKSHSIEISKIHKE